MASKKTALKRPAAAARGGTEHVFATASAHALLLPENARLFKVTFSRQSCTGHQYENVDPTAPGPDPPEERDIGYFVALEEAQAAGQVAVDDAIAKEKREYALWRNDSDDEDEPTDMMSTNVGKWESTCLGWELQANLRYESGTFPPDKGGLDDIFTTIKVNVENSRLQDEIAGIDLAVEDLQAKRRRLRSFFPDSH